jgi:hypothetical protein
MRTIYRTALLEVKYSSAVIVKRPSLQFLGDHDRPWVGAWALGGVEGQEL